MDSTETEQVTEVEVKKIPYKCTRILSDGTRKEYFYERPSTAKPPEQRMNRKKEYSKTVLNKLIKEISDEQLKVTIDFVRGLTAPPS